MQRIFAIDFSSSIEGSELYHSTLANLVKKLSNPGDLFVLWDHAFRFVSVDELMGIVERKEGGGGTSPIAIAEAVLTVDGYQEMELVIVTDGQVPLKSIDQCDTLISEHKMKFKQVTAYLVGSEADLSVVCPFIRYSPTNIVVVTSEGESAVTKNITFLSEEDIAVIENVSTISNFAQFDRAYESLERVLRARTIGTSGDAKLKDAMIAMQSRIIRSSGIDANGAGSTMRAALESGNLQLALNVGSQLVANNTLPSTFSPRINRLISISDGGAKCVFRPDEIQLGGAARAKEATEVKLDEVKDAPSEASTFVCPVSYEDEADPVILIRKPARPLLYSLGQKTIKQVAECPVNALFKKHFMAKFVESCDHTISLKTMRMAEEVGAPIDKSPVTRCEIVGAIPLGAHPSHVKAANWTLYQLMGGGKIIGNADMWFAVLWQAVEKGMIPYLTDILPFIREQMIWRLKNSVTNASITGFPGFVSTKLPLGCAIWYCLASPAFEKQPEISYDPLRLHCIHANIFRKMLALVDWKLPDGIVRHIKRLRALFALLSWSKFKSTYLKTYLMGLTQKWVYIDTRKVNKDYFTETVNYVPISGDPCESQFSTVMQNLPRRCLGLTREEIVGLASMVDRNLSGKDIPLPLNWAPPKLPEPISEWAPYEGRVQKLRDIEVCPRTMRPYYMTPDGKSWYDSLVEIIPVEREKVFSAHKFYAEFVVKNGAYPNREELITFFYLKYVESRKFKTLMSQIILMADITIEQFEKVTKGVPPAKFVELYTASVRTVVRMQLEGQSTPSAPDLRDEKGTE